MICQCSVSTLAGAQECTVMQAIGSRRDCGYMTSEDKWKRLYFLLSFAMNLKLQLKKNPFERKGKTVLCKYTHNMILYG